MASVTRDNIKQRPALESVERPQPGKDIAMAWGSDAVAEVLRQLGIEFIALVPGSSYRCLHDSLSIIWATSGRKFCSYCTKNMR